MLRVIVLDEPFVLKLRLQGTLNNESARGYQSALERARAQRGDRRLILDVGDLVLEDEHAGSVVLESMQGVEFSATNGRFADLLRAKEDRDCQARCGAFRRLAYSLSKLCESSSSRMCSRLSVWLHGNQITGR